jgi:hypothetical protein
MENYYYQNKEVIKKGGKKTVRLVSIQGGKGHKSVCHYHHGKHKKTYKKRICKEDMEMIKKGKFVSGLFEDCQPKKKE